MANYSNLKAAIADVIKTNGTNAITGQVLQDTLNSIVSVIGANYQFAGVATPATNPGTPDQNVLYFATETGLYPNFGGVNLERRSLYLLMWNGSWHVDDSLDFGDIYDEYIQQFINLLEQYQPIVIEGNVVNAPDEEDLTSVNDLLKFKNKSYFPENYSGLGRVFLRKNIVNGENVLTQAMMSESNTIYIIQYDHTLNEDITVPANCVLEFDGGSLSGNKTLTGNNTGISAGLVKIFHTDIVLAGTWGIDEYYPEWFGAKGNGSTDDSTAINTLVKMAPDNAVIKFSQGKTYACFINVFRNNITLMGYGSKLKGVSGAEGNVVTVGYPNYTGVGYDDSVDPSSTTWVYFNNINMYGFDIDGNYANVPHSETDIKGHGVLLTLIGRSTFKDMYIHDCHVTCFDNASKSNYNNIDITVANGGNSSAYGSNNYYPNFDVNSSYYCNFKIRSIGGKHGCRLDNNCRFNNCDFNIYDPALTGLRLVTAVAQNQLSDNIVNAVIDGNNKCTMYGFGLFGTDIAKAKNNIINVSVRKCNTTSEAAIGISGYGNIVNITSRENTAKVLSFLGKSNVITLCSNDDGTGLSGDTKTPLVNCVANSEQNKVVANITNFTGGRVLYVGTNCINNDIDISTDKAMIISDQSAGKSLIKQKYNARPIIWENSSPTSAVAAAFKIDISNYLSNGFNHLLIEFAASTSDNFTVYYAKLPAVINRISFVQAVKFENNQTVFMNRQFKYDQNNGKIFFWGGYTSTGDAATADNTILIPLRVYGCYIDG